jgi:hypothetical protein
MLLESGYYNLLQKPIYGLMVLGCVFLLVFSKDRTVEFHSKRTFYNAGLVGVILASLALVLPDSVPEVSGNITLSTFIYIFYQQFALHYNLLFLVFFGVFFIIEGYKNREKKGLYLQLAGVFWVIAHGSIIIGPYILGIFLVNLPPEIPVMNFEIFNIIPKIMGIGASIFLLLFGFFNKQKFLILVALFFLSSSLYAIFTGLHGIQFYSL